MPFATPDFPQAGNQELFLPGVSAATGNGIYGDLIETARRNGTEYSKIWDLFAFGESFTPHLARFTEGAIRTPASISVAMRELIAAFTSYQNQCRFCTQAHAAAASELFGNEELVWSALRNLETSTLGAKEKALLRFVAKVTKQAAGISPADVATVRAAGWDDEAIYYAITVCALFNFYNRWISATGVPEMSAEAHRLQGQKLAGHGYLRGEKK
ncbi:MAG TPA: peroxidase-related enzyme [Bryobacteraceae bacterium]|nr:peroxidase-related enzyme [Bryobacteraceae bacterium]